MLPIILTINNTDDKIFVEKLYLQYQKKIYCAAFKILNQREDAEDCVHDVVKTVIAHLDTFRSTDDSGRSKLLAICTRNAAFDLYRKNKTRRMRETNLIFNEEPDDELLYEINTGIILEQNPAIVAINKENKRRIAQMIAQMDDIYKDVLILHYLHHMKNNEIADILKISENSVAVRLHRAKRKLLKERGAELHEIKKSNGFV